MNRPGSSLSSRRGQLQLSPQRTAPLPRHARHRPHPAHPRSPPAACPPPEHAGIPGDSRQTEHQATASAHLAAALGRVGEQASDGPESQSKRHLHPRRKPGHSAFGIQPDSLPLPRPLTLWPSPRGCAPSHVRAPASPTPGHLPFLPSRKHLLRPRPGRARLLPQHSGNAAGYASPYAWSIQPLTLLCSAHIQPARASVGISGGHSQRHWEMGLNPDSAGKWK